MSVSEHNATRSTRTARKHYSCDEGTRRHRIAPGDRYLRHVIFPGHDVLNPDKPITLRECVACAIEHGREHETGACQTYCCSVEPCPKPFGHAGDHGCPICTPAPPIKETNVDGADPRDPQTAAAAR